MGGVAPNSPVSSPNTNQAFIDANGDDATIGRLDLQNTLPESGPDIINIQREHNAIAYYSGKAINAIKDILPAWVSTQAGTPSDNLTMRNEALTVKFDPSVGHTHSGSPGDGGIVQSSYIASVKLKGSFILGSAIVGASGTSTDVSSLMTGLTPSSGSTVKGVVVQASINRDVIRYENGDAVEDGTGNEVYGRITEASGVWTLSYFSLISGVETAYSFAAPTNLQWYFQQLFNPIVDAPVYSELAVVPSSSTTADVVDASETQAGKVALANTDMQPVSATNNRGTSVRAAKADHTHEGVHNLGVYGDATKIIGDVDLEAGNAITLTRSGQRIKIDGQGAIGKQETPGGPVNGTNDTFGPLSDTPSTAESLIFFIDGVALDKTLWTLTGLSITVDPSAIPVLGQSVYVFYITAGIPVTPPAPTGTLRTEFRTLTGTEITNKKLILAYLPAVPGDVLVDVIGGAAQEFNVDYTIVSNELRWNGYALDGILSSGDKLRVHYLT